MVAPLERLQRFGIQIGRVIHVGASTGQEIPDYRAAGVRAGLFVEPLDDCFAVLAALVADIPDYAAVQAVCTDRDGDVVRMHRASNNGESSSILAPKEHLTAHRHIRFEPDREMTTSRLDTLMRAHGPLGHGTSPLLYVLDVQGAELSALRGSVETLGQTTAAWVEVSHREMYEGNARFLDVLALMDGFGLKLVFCGINHKLYGDALFARI